MGGLQAEACILDSTMAQLHSACQDLGSILSNTKKEGKKEEKEKRRKTSKLLFPENSKTVLKMSQFYSLFCKNHKPV